SYDLYWIAVPPDFQGKGLGRRLLKEVEKRISSAGGKRSYVGIPHNGCNTPAPGPFTKAPDTAWKPSSRIFTARARVRRSTVRNYTNMLFHLIPGSDGFPG
ncbi:MAG: GNAT family N-acetyltransferase, partial [Desulfobacterales bacterium]|nr:GNAT family N-acetyltransferase [Desulfobacterales bacterium]